MKYLETKHEKRSFIITSVIFAVLLLLCFLFGLTYMDPPPENGIAINFGTSDFGMGDVQPTEPIRSAPQPTPTPPQAAPVEDNVATQDVDDAPVITNEKPKKETPKEQVKPTPKPDPAPTPSKSTTDALNSLINGPKSDGKATGGQGDDNKAGDKGRLDGTLGGSYGNGGGGTGTGNGNYQLGNRNALAKPAPKYTCNEQGIVVVQISVNRSGKVISANPGVRGTTNAATCLLEQARIAAMNTTWEADPDAPDKQVGKIIYNFKLTE